MFMGLKTELDKIANNWEYSPAEEFVNGKTARISWTKYSDSYDKAIKKRAMEPFKWMGVTRIWVWVGANGIALLLTSYCLYYSTVYGIKIIGIPW